MSQRRFCFLLVVLFTSSYCKSENNFKSLYDLKKDYNFGVLINNDEFQIYRSERLGKEGVEEVFSSLKELGFKVPKTIIYMNYMNYSFFLDHAVEEYEIQNDFDFKFYHSYDKNMRTYLDGRNPIHPKKDIDDLENLDFWARPSQNAIEQFEIKPDGKLDGGVDAFYRILAIALNPENQPVLFHCHGGIHRTGMIALAIRYLQGGSWTKAFKVPYYYDDDLLITNKAKQEYILFNPKKPRVENFQFIDSVSRSPEFKKLSKTYQSRLNK
ncbi:MAG: hypothetical protein A2381_01550 [Bdellovibrionales bacterium RIFOXYB1_FULL_37_110]|nr:MAG: hypothetical protein A2417_02405 [Bdellovibrionales bacterium RIFOXYC1_FULL_37_79]OFZ58901.1 MAG: hypothetical protein A2381_01550 [Bdellovibrionales bacterium RIFOXYB1_FULL_37_110]OFZ64653.1 MAG: hypothetical protein A2577_13385 [Bdellovibrionales bacterium RIFOXYD1_FULL_36_51]